MFNNFCKKYKGKALRTEVWAAAKATTVASFTTVMERIKFIDVDAYEWLGNKYPQEWSKSHFRSHCKCNVLLNNWCESFNGTEMLLETQEKPIISCLEHIRKYLIRSTQNVGKEQATIQVVHAISNGYSKFQITHGMGGQFAVDLANHACSCRSWDLSGIPCPHAVAAIYHQRHEPLDYVNAFYKKATMLKAYAYKHVTLADTKEWPKTSLRPIVLPLSKRQPGRPKRLRRRDPDEPAPPNATKLKKYNVVIYCTKCK
ncbi:hypothetical protein UlMin_013807 [Ulmus minor]